MTQKSFVFFVFVLIFHWDFKLLTITYYYTTPTIITLNYVFLLSTHDCIRQRA
jgi:hypothetical protein